MARLNHDFVELSLRGKTFPSHITCLPPGYPVPRGAVRTHTGSGYETSTDLPRAWSWPCAFRTRKNLGHSNGIKSTEDTGLEIPI